VCKVADGRALLALRNTARSLLAAEAFDPATLEQREDVTAWQGEHGPDAFGDERPRRQDAAVLLFVVHAGASIGRHRPAL